MRAYVKERCENDPEFRAKRLLRRFIYRVIDDKCDKTIELLGYNVKDLKNHLGRLPKKEECIDHKIPLSWFKEKTPPYIANNLMNLQILSEYDNLTKLNRWADPVDKEYYKECYKWIKQKHKEEVKYE